MTMDASHAPARSAAKRFVASVLSADALTALAPSLTRGRASIFMMHRFADPDRGNGGHDGTLLRRQLEYLRRMRYTLLPLADLEAHLVGEPARGGKCVAFTIDDGYADYASVAAPIFEAYDCPATVFVVSGVVDQRGWYWWDRVRVTLERSTRHDLTIEPGGQPLRLAWSPATAAATARALVERLKHVPDSERRALVDALPALVDADVPSSPPDQYAPMTWDEIRACGRGVTTFGPHTVSHPILARTDDATAHAEMCTSWERLRAETDAAIPVFCYPNGERDDAGVRETGIARDIGMRLAVTTRPGYASRGDVTSSDRRFLLPRFPYPDDTSQLVQVVNGIERVKRAIRASLRPGARP